MPRVAAMAATASAAAVMAAAFQDRLSKCPCKIRGPLQADQDSTMQAGHPFLPLIYSVGSNLSPPNSENPEAGLRVSRGSQPLLHLNPQLLTGRPLCEATKS